MLSSQVNFYQHGFHGGLLAAFVANGEDIYIYFAFTSRMVPKKFEIFWHRAILHPEAFLITELILPAIFYDYLLLRHMTLPTGCVKQTFHALFTSHKPLYTVT